MDTSQSFCVKQPPGSQTARNKQRSDPNTNAATKDLRLPRAVIAGESSAVASSVRGHGRSTATSPGTSAEGSVATGVGSSELLAASAPSSSATAPAHTPSPSVSTHRLEPGRTLLLVLDEEHGELASDIAVLVVHVAQSVTHVTHSAGTPDSVHVVVDVAGQVVVDHLSDIGDVEASRRHIGRHKHGTVPALELSQGVFSLTLALVAVDGDGGDASVQKGVLELVGTSLGLHEDEHESVLHDREEVEHRADLLVLLDPLDLLGDVLGRGADSAHREEHVVLHEVAGETLDLHWEGGAEHEGLSLEGHVRLDHDAANLRLEPHVEHSVGLVENQKLNAVESDAPALHEVDEATGSGNEKVYPAIELALLQLRVVAAVDHHGGDAGAVAELVGLVIDLRGELSSGGKNQCGGVATPASAPSRLGKSSLAKKDGNGREQEPGGFARPGLRACHHVVTGDADGNGVLLHGSGSEIPTELDVLVKLLSDGLDGELGDRLRAPITHLHRNIVVLVKIDPGGLRTLDAKKLRFNTSIGTHVAVKSQGIASASGAKAPAAVTASTSAAAAEVSTRAEEATLSCGSTRPSEPARTATTVTEASPIALPIPESTASRSSSGPIPRSVIASSIEAASPVEASATISSGRTIKAITPAI